MQDTEQMLTSITKCHPMTMDEFHDCLFKATILTWRWTASIYKGSLPGSPTLQHLVNVMDVTNIISVILRLNFLLLENACGANFRFFICHFRLRSTCIVHRDRKKIKEHAEIETSNTVQLIGKMATGAKKSQRVLGLLSCRASTFQWIQV